MTNLNGAHLRAVLIPLLQTLILLSCIVSVTILGIRGVIDAAAVTAIVGAIAGSVGVLAGVQMGRTAPPISSSASGSSDR